VRKSSDERSNVVVEAGWPGLRLMKRFQSYERQHTSTDDLAHVNFGYVTRLARFDAAIVVLPASRRPAP
jgi:hypothetical protein